MTHDELKKVTVTEARSWIGTPYKRNACFKGKGIDCARFICEVFKVVGVIPAGYKLKPVFMDWYLAQDVDHEMFSRELQKFFDVIPYDSRDVGDVVSFMFNNTESHTAIISDNDKIIHAHDKLGVVERSLNSLKHIVVRVYRAKAVNGKH